MFKNSRYHAITVGLAYLSFISLGLGAGLLGVAWPSMSAEFGVPLADQGVLGLAATAGGLTASFYSGALARRLGVGRLMLLGSTAIALGLLAYAFAPSWLLLIVLALVYGTGTGTVDASMNAYAAQHFSERVMNWLHASFGIGVTITPLIMTAVFASNLSWRVGYLIVGIGAALMAFLLLLTRNHWVDASNTTDHLKETAKPVSMGATLRLPLVWIGVAMMFLVAGMETTPGNWIFTLFTEGRSIPEVAAAQWVSIYWGSFTVGRIFFGAIISRVNTTVLLRLCLFGAACGAALLWWNALPWVGFVGLTLLGFAQAPVYPVMTSNTPRRVGQQHAANAIGFQVAGAGAGLALLPAFAGVLAGLINLEVIPPFIFFATISLLGLFQISTMAAARAERKRQLAAG